MDAGRPLAVIGAGHLGSFHARALGRLLDAEPRWIVDLDPQRAGRLAKEVGATPASLEDALTAAQAVIIATPTETHAALATQAIEAGCHVLLEKPMTETVEEAEGLVALAEREKRILQIGHIERFNPAFQAARDLIGEPAFMESERLAPFVTRSLDIDVVLDLMIHDLDILLSLVPSELTALDAVGVSVLTGREDIANAWLRFDNGSVAHLSASRVSPEKVRKVRFFGHAGYVSLDFLARSGHRAVLCPDGSGGTRLCDEPLAVAPGDALGAEIESFLTAIADGGPAEVSGQQGLRVLHIAARIQQEVRGSLAHFRARAAPRR